MDQIKSALEIAQAETTARLQAENAELVAQIAALNAKAAKVKAAPGISCKVGTKGGLSVYIPGAHYPVTLYADQWDVLLKNVPEVKAFMLAHRSEFSTKDK